MGLDGVGTGVDGAGDGSGLVSGCGGVTFGAGSGALASFAAGGVVTSVFFWQLGSPARMSRVRVSVGFRVS